MQDAITHSALLKVIHKFEDATNVATEPVEAHVVRTSPGRIHPRAACSSGRYIRTPVTP